MFFDKLLMNDFTQHACYIFISTLILSSTSLGIIFNFDNKICDIDTFASAFTDGGFLDFSFSSLYPDDSICEFQNSCLLDNFLCIS